MSPPITPPRHYFARGHYFKFSSPSPVVNGLVYPVPNKDLSGLGIHATKNLDGSVKFGPDVEVRRGSEERIDELGMGGLRE